MCWEIHHQYPPAGTSDGEDEDGQAGAYRRSNLEQITSMSKHISEGCRTWQLRFNHRLLGCSCAGNSLSASPVTSTSDGGRGSQQMQIWLLTSSQRVQVYLRRMQSPSNFPESWHMPVQGTLRQHTLSQSPQTEKMRRGKQELTAGANRANRAPCGRPCRCASVLVGSRNCLVTHIVRVWMHML